MDVRLLNHTPDPERAVAVAARLCYAPVGAAELMEHMDDAAVRKVLKVIMVSGHYSALEHAGYTFAVDGVSRAMTHQLIRHRLASYNQQSQRYVSFTEEPDFVVPPAVAADPTMLERVEAKRITLNPDCGFAPGSAARVDIDEVYLKLRAEAEAARMLRARHG